MHVTTLSFLLLNTGARAHAAHRRVEASRAATRTHTAGNARNGLRD